MRRGLATFLKVAYLLSLTLSILLVEEVTAQAISKQTSVVENGETMLAARSSKFDVRVLIRTRPVEKTTEPPVEPGSYVKRSRVERIEIMVGGKQIFVPRSVFLELFDLYNAEIQLGPKKVVLALDGGDASESYWVKIEFDAKQVKRRTSGSGMIPGKVGEETIYHQLILKDE